MEAESGELFEHTQREMFRERLARFQELGMEPKDAARFAELVAAHEHTQLTPSEQAERQSLMEKYKDKGLAPE